MRRKRVTPKKYSRTDFVLGCNFASYEQPSTEESARGDYRKALPIKKRLSAEYTETLDTRKLGESLNSGEENSKKVATITGYKHEGADVPELSEKCVGEETQESSRAINSRRFTFTLDADRWANMQPDQEPGKQRKLKGRWTDEFQQEVNSLYPGCVLVFWANKVKVLNSRKRSAPFFRGKAKCKDIICKGEFSFEIEDEPKNKDCVEVRCLAVGSFEHEQELARKRQVKGQERVRVSGEIEKESSSIKYYYRELGDMPEAELAMGNITRCQTPAVLRKVVSDIVQKELLHQNLVQEITLLKEAFQSEEDAFIHYIGASPFSICMYSNTQLDLMRSLSAENRLDIYLDATGSVVFRIPGEKRPLLYSLVVKPSPDVPPVSVADLLTTDHTVPSILHFLSAVKRDTLLLGKCVWRKVETDWSWALVQACLQTFNHTSTKEYISICWKILSKEYQDDYLKSVTVIHLCAAHMIKDFANTISPIVKKDKALKIFSMRCFASLQNSTNLSHACKIFELMCRAMGNPRNCDQVNDAVQTLKHMFKNADLELDESELPAQAPHMKETIGFEQNTIKKASPFTDVFCGILEMVPEAQGTETDISNMYYCRKLLSVLTDKFLPIYPLWSGVLLGDIMRYRKDSQDDNDVSITRDTNAPAEGWFKAVKVDTLGKKRKRVSQFVCTLRKTVRSRLREATNPHIRAKKRKVKKPLEATEEQWGKKRRKRANLYHTNSPSKWTNTVSEKCKSTTSTSTNSEKQTCKTILKLDEDKFPRVAAWGGKVLSKSVTGETTDCNLVNTCPIDNGLTILHLSFLEDNCFRSHLMQSKLSNNVTKLMLECCELMEKEQFNEAKGLWITGVLDRNLEKQMNLWGSEWELFGEAINRQLLSTLTSHCDNADCPQQRRMKFSCKGITISMPPGDTANTLDLQEFFKSWISPPTSRCGCKFPDGAVPIKYFKDKIQEIDESGNSSTREYLYCAGNRRFRRVVYQAPPVIVVPVSDLVRVKKMCSDIRDYSTHAVIGRSQYRVAGASYHRQGHFVGVVNSSKHGWLFYDGLLGRLQTLTDAQLHNCLMENIFLVHNAVLD